MIAATGTEIEKLAALRRLGGFLGMWRHSRPTTLTVAGAMLLILRLVDKEASEVARIACAMMLDYGWPEWRSRVSVEILGYAADRHDAEALRWRQHVLERDGFSCKDCGSNESLEAHHILHWANHPEARLVLENGKTLCCGCHLKAHDKKART